MHAASYLLSWLSCMLAYLLPLARSEGAVIVVLVVVVQLLLSALLWRSLSWWWWCWSLCGV